MLNLLALLLDNWYKRTNTDAKDAAIALLRNDCRTSFNLLALLLDNWYKRTNTDAKDAASSLAQRLPNLRARARRASR